MVNASLYNSCLPKPDHQYPSGPSPGGKGMYGHHVHEAVIAAGEKESGITIHYVNDHYDQGAIIFQAKCPVLPTDTPDDLAARVHELEYRYFPQIIEETILKQEV